MEDFIRRRRLKSVKLGVAGGIVFGSYLAMTNHLHYLFPCYGQRLVEMWQELYPWYEPNFWGSFILWGWGFLDAFFLLWMVGVLYNWLTQAGYGCRHWDADKYAKKTPDGGSQDTKKESEKHAPHQ